MHWLLILIGLAIGVILGAIFMALMVGGDPSKD